MNRDGSEWTAEDRKTKTEMLYNKDEMLRAWERLDLAFEVSSNISNV